METGKFIELQYLTLRKEIEYSKANMFKLAIGGGTAVPIAQYFAHTYAIGEITLALPLMVVVLVLLFLAENHAVMRAGTYILQEIEPRILGIKGWETWLSLASGNVGTRTVDKLVVIAFSVLASSYFLVSVVLAVRYANEEFGGHWIYLVSGSYLGVGLILAFVIYQQARTNTSIKTP